MTTADSFYAFAVEERYRVLKRARQLARQRPDWGLRLREDDALAQELRALVRVRWFVRSATRSVERRRAAPWALPYHDHQARGPVTEDDLLAGYGLDPEGASDAINREGDPAWNGAFNRW